MSAIAPSSSSYQVVLCSTPHQLREAAKIRMDVFIAEQGFDVKDELDLNDAICAHFLLVHTDNPSRGLATVRWVPYPTEAILAQNQEAIATRSSQLEGLPLGRPQTTQELTRSFVAAGQAKLGRLAAREEIRGRGLGAKIVVDSEDWIKTILAANLAPGEEVKVGLKMHSQMQVVKFYERLGYQASGEPFDEDGAPHMLCSKEVTIVGT